MKSEREAKGDAFLKSLEFKRGKITPPPKRKPLPGQTSFIEDEKEETNAPEDEGK
jgi:hypothetical protein